MARDVISLKAENAEFQEKIKALANSHNPAHKNTPFQVLACVQPLENFF